MHPVIGASYFIYFVYFSFTPYTMCVRCLLLSFYHFFMLTLLLFSSVCVWVCKCLSLAFSFLSFGIVYAAIFLFYANVVICFGHCCCYCCCCDCDCLLTILSFNSSKTTFIKSNLSMNCRISPFSASILTIKKRIHAHTNTIALTHTLPRKQKISVHASTTIISAISYTNSFSAVFCFHAKN